MTMKLINEHSVYNKSQQLDHKKLFKEFICITIDYNYELIIWNNKAIALIILKLIKVWKTFFVPQLSRVYRVLGVLESTWFKLNYDQEDIHLILSFIFWRYISLWHRVLFLSQYYFKVFMQLNVHNSRQ